MSGILRKFCGMLIADRVVLIDFRQLKLFYAKFSELAEISIPTKSWTSQMLNLVTAEICSLNLR